MATICINFDQTILKENNDEVPYVVDALREIQERNNIILFTTRQEQKLRQAIRFLNISGIFLWGINVNPEDKRVWNGNHKLSADLYIDSKGIGCPLVYPRDKKPYADWIKILVILKERKFI